MSVPMSMMQDVAWEIAEDHGWHDEPRTVGDRLALIHSEISEALEDFRSGHPVDEVYFEGEKPCGVGVELADAIIRILDFAQEEGINMDVLINRKQEYNRTRPYRHGGKAL